MIDLEPRHAAIVRSILGRLAPDCDVRIFGSRINGSAHPYSDIDISIKAEGQLSREQIESLCDAFSASDLPFMVDLVDWHGASTTFRQIIDLHAEPFQ